MIGTNHAESILENRQGIYNNCFMEIQQRNTAYFNRKKNVKR